VKATRKRAPKVKQLTRARAPAKKQARPKQKASRSRWVALVAKHGLMLAAAHGPVLNVAHFVADEPIIGGWWAHPRGKAIFAALAELDDSDEIHSFKLFEGKITFAHRKVWPALVRLAREGVIAEDLLALVEASGERNVIVPFPLWVDAETATAADGLSLAAARAALPFFE
jgi:hypothetical protein